MEKVDHNIMNASFGDEDKCYLDKNFKINYARFTAAHAALSTMLISFVFYRLSSLIFFRISRNKNQQSKSLLALYMYILLFFDLIVGILIMFEAVLRNNDKFEINEP